MAGTEQKQLLQAGIAAARAGEKEQARHFLLQVIELDEEVEAAWLWLSSVVDDDAERQICLENVLALNPDNEAARAGLRWLQQHSTAETTAPAIAPAPSPPPAPAPSPAPSPGGPLRQEPAPTPPIEIDPYGCPFCGGPINTGEPRCLDCNRRVTERYQLRGGGTRRGWVVVCFLLLGATSALEGLMAAGLQQMEQLPSFFDQTALRLIVGPALILPAGGAGEPLPGQLIAFAGIVALLNYLLAGLCAASAIGLAIKNRAAYFGSFLLGGVLVVATGTGLLTGLSGWAPSLLRLGLIGLTIRWLADSAPAFEWQTRHYNADLDPDLHTDLDYYQRGQRYREMGMWAKAAAHWKVAAQLAAGKPEYRGLLARAYLHMGYPQAALAEVDRALAQLPDDEKLQAFRASLLQRGEQP